MPPSTESVVDVVFCLDASASMAPSIAGVRRHIGAFLSGLAASANGALHCRIDFLAHSCDPSGQVVRSFSLRKHGADLIAALYGPNPQPQAFFTTDVAAIQAGLERIELVGDEAMLLALDLCLDYPWRPRAGCHRVVILLTDEPLEANAAARYQRQMISQLIEKIHALGVMLFIVAPKSAGYNELAEADKSQYQQVVQTHDGLGSLDFHRVLSHIGKSVSVTMLQELPDRTVRRALFGQNHWVSTTLEIQSGQ
jgi:hypothetical protein